MLRQSGLPQQTREEPGRRREAPTETVQTLNWAAVEELELSYRHMGKDGNMGLGLKLTVNIRYIENNKVSLM